MNVVSLEYTVNNFEKAQTNNVKDKAYLRKKSLKKFKSMREI